MSEGQGRADQWLAVDWGTSNVRLWHMDGETVRGHARSSAGMASLSPPEYPAALAALIAAAGAPSGLTAFVCGMAGARGGWREAGYGAVPTRIDALARSAVAVETGEAARRAYILPGLSQSGDGAEDVMRGEETQLAGLMSDAAFQDGVVILPGTHGKWVEVRAGAVERFSSAMTGEVFGVLSEQSVLRHTVQGADDPAAGEEGRAVGIATGRQTPERLLANLFRARAAGVLTGKPAAWCRGYLSGLLIASEVAGLAKSFALGEKPVVLIGAPALCDTYMAVFEQMGIAPALVSAEDAVVRGLSVARSHLEVHQP